MSVTSTVEPAIDGTARDRNFFYVAVGLCCLPVLKVWILGTVNVSRLRQVSSVSRFRVRQVSLCWNFVYCRGTKLDAGVLNIFMV
jgi:hypothetical protein